MGYGLLSHFYHLTSSWQAGYLEIQDQLWKPSAPQCIYNLYRKKVTIALDSIDKDCPVKGLQSSH